MKDWKVQILIFCIVAFSPFLFFSLTMDSYNVTECGEVVKKYEGMEYKGRRKHRYSEHAYYLDVKYSDRYETHNVTTNTYYNNQVGEQVCFTDISDKGNKYGFYSVIWIVICFFIVIFISLNSILK